MIPSGGGGGLCGHPSSRRVGFLVAPLFGGFGVVGGGFFFGWGVGGWWGLVAIPVVGRIGFVLSLCLGDLGRCFENYRCREIPVLSDTKK